MSQNVVSGARCKVGFIDPATNQANYIGIFNNVSYGVRYDAVPIYILGRYNAAGIEYTAAETVNVSCNGYRVIDHGPYSSSGKMPNLQDLINGANLIITIFDRAGKKQIMRVYNCLPVGFDTTITVKQLEEMGMQFIGIKHEDESNFDINEDAGASNLLDA